MLQNNYKPSKLLYVISILILVVGIIAFIFILITGITSSVNSINTRVVVPGTKAIELNESGNYNIYCEYSSIVDGKVFETSSINGLVCKLKNIETSEYINLDKSTSNSTYSINEREGQSLFSFNIDKPGTYEIDASYENGDGEQAVLAIGKGFGGRIALTIVLSIVILLIAIAGSIILFVYTYKKMAVRL